MSAEHRTAPLRYTAVWVKRPGGREFVSWQSGGFSTVRDVVMAVGVQRLEPFQFDLVIAGL